MLLLYHYIGRIHCPFLLLYQYYIGHSHSIVTVISLYWTYPLSVFTVISVLYWTWPLPCYCYVIILDVSTVRCYCYISIILDIATPLLLLYHYIGHSHSIFTVISVLYWTWPLHCYCYIIVLDVSTVRFYCYISIILDIATPLLLLYHYIGHSHSIFTVISVLYWTLSIAHSCLFGIRSWVLVLPSDLFVVCLATCQ